ncbi:hypothetical protein D8674_004137 [Pyrus ussuriensis x Pyrus communis]|uniref:Uncharacterized protein n=1 Tax=Pyrus ussuriensis x Pyrus communis TaxID=2448454 RepID=A0A5N5FPF3_9ROSA|nr:hypothetical protein D8674_004137 [Pyrus ussuriensis x Pyrus communis]
MCTSFWSDIEALVPDKCAADWESWRVMEVKMHMIDELVISNLISNCWAASRVRQTPYPALPDGLINGPGVLRRLSGLVRLPLSPLRRILDIVWLQQMSSIVRWPATLPQLSGIIAPSCGSHGKLSLLNWFTQWKSNLYKHCEKYSSLEVALAVECPIDLVDRRDEWEWLCGYFQGEKYLISEIDMFKEMYIQAKDELTEQLHSTMVEKGQIVLEEVASQVPLETSIEEVFLSEDASFLRAWESPHSGPICLILEEENKRGRIANI